LECISELHSLQQLFHYASFEIVPLSTFHSRQNCGWKTCEWKIRTILIMSGSRETFDPLKASRKSEFVIFVRTSVRNQKPIRYCQITNNSRSTRFRQSRSDETIVPSHRPIACPHDLQCTYVLAANAQTCCMFSCLESLINIKRMVIESAPSILLSFHR